MSEGQVDDDERKLIKIETTLWGAYGNNGLNSKVNQHSREIGDLYGRDEALRTQISDRISSLDDRISGLYRMIALMAVSVTVGAIGMIATLLVTRK